jgi:meiotic recombination protein SPO11
MKNNHQSRGGAKGTAHPAVSLSQTNSADKIKKMSASTSFARAQLETFLSGIIKDMKRNGCMKDLLVPKANHHELAGILDLEGEGDGDLPSSVRRRSLQSTTTAKMFAQIIAICGLVAELIDTGKEISLRDVYYALKHLFKTQAECNNSILEVGMLLGLKRYDMNIVPSSKGLVAGPLRFKFSDAGGIGAGAGAARERKGWSTCFETDNEDAGILISSKWTSCSSEDIDLQLSVAETRYLIVVEKEGVFRRLVKEHFCKRVPCIMVTGCGFPDMATRALVAKVSDRFPDLVVVGLCDYNPYGIALLLSYRFSSQASAFEGLGLQAEGLKWLGLRSSQIDTMRNDSSFDEASAFQQMSQADRAKVRAMLCSEIVTGALPEEYEAELHAMLAGEVKCELETLYSLGSHYMSDFLESALQDGDYI